MDVDETAGALNELVKSGKVKHIGVSNFTPSQFQLLDSRMDQPLVTNQVELSPMEMGVLHDGTIDQCQRLQVSPMAWSPLAGGRIFTEDSEKAQRLRSVLGTLGEKHDCSIAEVALAWVLAHPSRVIPIIGSNNMDRMKQMVGALEVKLSREEWFEVWQGSAGTEVP